MSDYKQAKLLLLTFTFTGYKELREIFLRTPRSWRKPQPPQFFSAAENPLPSSGLQARVWGSGMQHRSLHHCFHRKELDTRARKVLMGRPAGPQCRGFIAQHRPGAPCKSSIMTFSDLPVRVIYPGYNWNSTQMWYRYRTFVKIHKY